jgi:rubrerythrin
MLDVYICRSNHEFAVKDGQEPHFCPFCGDLEIEFSHEVKDLEGDLEGVC